MAAAVDEVRDFLRAEGFELVEGHIVGKSTGGAVAQEHFKDAMGSYEVWYVVARKIGEPKTAAVKRIVERPLKSGLRFQWGDE